jgi:circadian clock protein KaiC
MPSEVSSSCTTGVPGLDSIIGGGYPKNRLFLIEGDPGAGKTTLALQFLIEGARQGEKGLYISLSETRDELLAVAGSHGWDLEPIAIFELSAIEEQLKGGHESTFFHPSEVLLNKTTDILLEQVERANPVRVVFDSLSELRLMAETPLRYRRQVLSLKQYFAGRKCTVLFLDDRTSDAKDLQVRSLAHGVINLERSSPEYGISRRVLMVEKIRGVKFREGFHDFTITTGGLVIFPRLVASEHHRPFSQEVVTSGIAQLDSLIGGGLSRGTSTMFMGPPGTGKSTLAMQFASAAAQRGEQAEFFTFDETIHTLTVRSNSLGMKLTSSVDSGLLRLHQIDPAEISPGELTDCIRKAVEERDARVVVLDSINGYLNAMPEERFLTLQLHELLSYLNQQGVVTIMLLAQQGMIGSMQSAVDLTYLADSVLLLRFFEAAGEVRQAISMVKKRSGDHERTLREYKISRRGVEVGDVLRSFRGIMSGIPEYVGDDTRMIKTR